MGDKKLADAPLTFEGEGQAQALQDRVQTLGPELIVVSPLTRALQTADLAFKDLQDVPRLAHPSARERMSSLYSERRSDLHALRARFPTFDFSLLASETDDMWKGTWEYQ